MNEKINKLIYDEETYKMPLMNDEVLSTISSNIV